AGGFGGFFSLFGTTITLSGNAEADTLHGALGVDQVVHGRGGNDRIFSSGEGQYFGDYGNDTIFAGLSSGLIDGVLNGGEGIDTLDTSSYENPYVIDLATGETNFQYESFINFENLVTGAGNDTLFGTGAANIINAGGGDDRIEGRGGNDTLLGGGGADVLAGLSGDDVLDGGEGADNLSGGAGNDLYYVDNAGDAVTELSGGGNDRVQSQIDYTLGNHVENLTLKGAGAVI